MSVRLANSPVSWGVEDPADERNSPWQEVLDDMATAGYAGTELGVVGYLPEDPARLQQELAARELRLVAGYVHCPSSNDARLHGAEKDAHRVCQVLRTLGAEHLVIIDERPSERLATAGNSSTARRLERREFQLLMDSIASIANIAMDGYGLTPVLHHHTAGYIEFADEIERAMEAPRPGRDSSVSRYRPRRLRRNRPRRALFDIWSRSGLSPSEGCESRDQRPRSTGRA